MFSSIRCGWTRLCFHPGGQFPNQKKLHSNSLDFIMPLALAGYGCICKTSVCGEGRVSVSSFCFLLPHSFITWQQEYYSTMTTRILSFYYFMLKRFLYINTVKPFKFKLIGVETCLDFSLFVFAKKWTQMKEGN